MASIHNMTIKEIKEFLSSSRSELSPQLERDFRSDRRAGVRRLWDQYSKKRAQGQELKDQWKKMSEYENNLWKQGYSYIVGVDEAGRGPLAGPVVAAAVILPKDIYLPGLNDSKKLTPAKREELYHSIVEQAVSYHVAFADAALIDEINIYQSTMRAMAEAVSGLDRVPDICLIDGMRVPSIPIEQIALIGGDGLSISIAAASVLAKVTRDNWMSEAAKMYPEYGFERNAGYGTPGHLTAIAKYGPCPLHRKTFRGVKEWL